MTEKSSRPKNAVRSPDHTAPADEVSRAEAERMRDLVLDALEEAKGREIAVLDVTALTDICDYMVVVSGASDRHIKTLAERVLEKMHGAGWRQIGIEGEDARDWVLVDFVDVVVHIMRRETRKRYDLEGLWDRTFGELRKEGDAAGGGEQDDGSRTDAENTAASRPEASSG
ncbi:MAG: ribosome silencing factor [Gammaproteobacteria bacterium]|nr:ribosome silencing factor [Gammaproteobacteria bacterium]MYG68006.1 ribosome silencing factor [Gammaproteobacteria bacterium]